jgi:hypothetical protein
MSETKIKVPKGMLEAAHVCCDEQVISKSVCPFILEAALRWQSENPPMPTTEQIWGCGLSVGNEDHKSATEGCRAVAVEWIRRMYDAPEPKVPEEQLLGEVA